MDLSNPGLTYALLLLPMVIAFVVIGQGVSKVIRKEPEGPVALVFGILFLVLIATAWWFFIR